MKLWSGRFSSDTDALVDELNASITFDKRLYKEDIAGSIAHAGMLGDQGIIEKSEAGKIIAALNDILADIEAGKFEFSLQDEDIHMSVEAELTRRIGDAGKRLHTARSRNDQVALDFRLHLKKEIENIRDAALAMMSVLLDIAGKNTETIMPAYTHLQRAQPTTFAHHMMAYANMLRRDVTRLEDCLARMDECPLGSGALTGTTYPIDRRSVARKLGFARITENSLDGVSDRDYAVELLSGLSILMMHLSRFAEEIILWCSWEFKFIELSDAYSTGSSIMPQKKNPDIAELVRGKTGRVYGSLMGLLTVMKGLPLAYNKDMQEDKEQVFDAVDTVKKVLPVFTAMLATMAVKPDNMRRAASEGFINATDCADYLVKKGLPFRDAYTVIGKLVHHCIDNGQTLEALTLETYKAFSPLFEGDVFDAVRLENCVGLRNVPGGPSAESVRAQLDSVAKFLKERTK
ncbi:argininosuccinate lyase [Sporobacter termitidis DSM 10068]|uniref:Argininosuccinate lyase n=1 Tax=Sporobacter termitidis DSM 10068 TaxID=1123282 RepID=A0A1M5Y1V9_9FIRM|nr:argininosuccinate lyase [Sporobacter termitidis]SHI05929.1 argininosuccinate lyase [Sporobacter termitidis DSM 10068]